MRVLVFADEYDYSYFTFIYNEVKRLEQSGIEVLVVCERVGQLMETDTNYRCIPLTENYFLRKVYLQAIKRKMFFLLSFFNYYKRRKKIISLFKPDIIHTHFGDTAVRLYFTLAKSLMKIPFLVSFHGFDASSLLNNQQYLDRLKKLTGKPNFFAIYVSKHLYNNLIKRDVNINDENSFLLFCGINTEKFKRTKYHNNPVRVFLQISSFFEKKGHVYTIDAFKKFHDLHPGKAKLVIGGDGPLKMQLMAKSKALGLENMIEFKGWISREVAVELMNEADYFVHHSVTGKDGDQEGLPNSIIEAMAMELPVLSTFHSGIPEIVEDGVNGYLVSEKDINAYAQRIEDMLSWNYLPVSREKVIKQFSLEAHTISLLNIYKIITNKVR